jgi:hypothetical protein
MKDSMRILISGFILFSWIAGCAWAQETKVTASVGSDSVGLQDQFQFSITVSGKDSSDADPPRLQSVKGFTILSGPNVSTQFQWINGRTSNSRTFTYILLPELEGEFTIGPVEVRVGGKVFRTQQVRIRVTATSPRSSPVPKRSTRPFDPFDPFGAFGDEDDLRGSQPSADAIFVKAEPDRDTAYVGEQVTLVYRVYTQVGINGFQLEESPPLTGFWVEDLDVEKNPKGTRKIVNGREYLVFTLRKQALFPTATGKLKISPSLFAFSTETGGNLFRAFGPTETVYRRTQALTVDAKPLPSQGKPVGFGNAVGKFKLSASVDKNHVAAGEAVALQIKLEGQGNFKMIPDISLPEIQDLTIYSSNHTDAIHPSPSGRIEGSKLWEYAIVPKAPGRQTIPEISFSFFDPEQEKFETVSTPAITLEVSRGVDDGESSDLSGIGKQDLVRRGTDINFIKMSAGSLDQSGSPLHRSRWIWILAVIPLSVNVVIIIRQRRRYKINKNGDVVRSRRAKRNALRHLRSAEKEGNVDARRFYDQASAALSAYLSDRFNLTEIELTADTLERAFAPKAIQREVLEETRACLQECDFGRFISASASLEKRNGLSNRIRKNIDALERASAHSQVSL